MSKLIGPFWGVGALFLVLSPFGLSAQERSGSISTTVPLPPSQSQGRVDESGVAHTPAVQIPYSDLASPQAKKDFIALYAQSHDELSPAAPPTDIHELRRQVDAEQKPGFDRLLNTFPVDIKSEVIGGVPTRVITPKSQIPSKNRNRILINLHGGGMMVAWTYGAQEESIPIASLGGFKVVTVDYRMAPEHHFPAASEDVVSVYRELLKSYRPENIGIYGCSSGAVLTAQAVAWFETHGLPRPGAIGLFGQGALSDSDYRYGDANYVSALLTGGAIPLIQARQQPEGFEYAGQADPTGPLLSPGRHREVLRQFPSTLLVSGTRDIGLSSVLFTHAQMVDAGVDADLHVWEGATHCSFAQGLIDPDVPETRQAWKVITHFFEKHLHTEAK
jgi:acetyl esterase/lipase